MSKLIAIGRTDGKKHPRETLTAITIADAMQLHIRHMKCVRNQNHHLIDEFMTRLKERMNLIPEKFPPNHSKTQEFYETELPKKLTKIMDGLIAQDKGAYLYTGNLICGIRTEVERDWITKKNGIIIDLLTPGQPIPDNLKCRVDYLPFRTDGNINDLEDIIKMLAEHPHWET